jgi:uncharacterized protein (TIGR03663 family)
LSTVGIRFVPAVFGTATVYLSLATRRYLGRWGALGATALLAFSPGAVYFSRYFIHEVPFVFFTLAIVIAGGRYCETRRLISLTLLAVSASFLFATKETAIITLAVLVISWVLTVIFMRLRLGPLQIEFLGWENGTVPWLPLSIALTAFVSVHVLFYSSFGTNFPRGVYDSLVTYRYWFATAAGNALHDRFAYLQWLAREEPLLLLLGMAGIALALFRGRNTFALFCGFWSTGMLVVYSLIPYKTPWLLLNVILPLALVGGYAIGEASSVISFLRPPLRSVLTILLVLTLLLPAYHAVDISFFRYDDDSVAYVYVHTQRGFLSMVGKIDEIATHVGTGTNTSIVVACSDYWPLPWYLRDYTDVGYWGHVVPTTGQIVIGRDFQASQLQSVLGEDYELAGRYNLRPGVGLVLFSRRERRP